METGTRVGAILRSDEKRVELLGYGVYEGMEVPPEGMLHDLDVPNPKIRLDNGTVVWGYQCWWGMEDRVKESIGEREVVTAVVGG